MQKEIRRCYDNLIGIGTGVSLFGIWTVIHIIMIIIRDREQLITDIQKSANTDKRWAITSLCILAAVFALIILSLHLYIGLSARKVGLGGKKRKGYLIATGLYIIIYCIAITSEVVTFQTTFQNIPDGVVTIFIDITMLITFAELMLNAVRAGKLSARLTEKGGVKDAG